MIRAAARPCPVCLHASVSPLHIQRFLLPENHPLADGYEVVCCERCGFVYADSAVTQEDYDRFYASLSKYEDNKTATGGGESPSDAQRLKVTAECIAAALPDKSGRILDVGCANGGLLLRLKQLGYPNVCGYDLPARCVENTRALGIEAHVGSVTKHPANAGQFDLIILSHVMEHLHEPRRSIQSLEPLLRAGGQIYIEVPDASEYVSHIAAPFQDFNTEHINHFSLQAMANLMGQLGFSGHGIGQKIFDSSPGMPYPALYGFWRKTPNPGFAIQRDPTLVNRIRDYITRSRAMMDDMDGRLKKALAKSPEVIVWGTGQLAMKLLVETCLARAKIVMFIDGNPINVGKKLNGIEIQSPSHLAGKTQPIVITTTLHQQAIANRIRNELKLPNEIIFLAGA
ncbi:MAG TPA: class I SAM-dependent methyltransferase [Verrucomicrobiae bacterium]|jgi:SAM-dependent methyltransferase